MLSPGSRRTSHTRTCWFSNKSFWPTSPSAIPRPEAALKPNSSISGSLDGRNDSNGVHLDEIVRRGHLRDLDHGGGGQRRPEVLRTHFVNGLEVLHVAHIHVHPAHIVERASGSLNGRLDVFAHLPRLFADVADPRNAAVRLARGHAGDEDNPSRRLHRGRMREDAIRLAQLRARKFGLRHCWIPWS